MKAPKICSGPISRNGADKLLSIAGLMQPLPIGRPDPTIAMAAYSTICAYANQKIYQGAGPEAQGIWCRVRSGANELMGFEDAGRSNDEALKDICDALNESAAQREKIEQQKG